MTRITCWILSVVALLVVAGMNAQLRWFIDVPSMLVAWAFPVLLLFVTFSPTRVIQAVRDLVAPVDSGIGAHQYAVDARMVSTLGVLSLSFGIVGSLMALVAILINLADPNVIPAQVALSLQTILYAFILNVFIVLPAQGILEERRKEATLVDDSSEGF